MMFDLHAYVAAEMGGATVRLLQTMEGVRHATALPASSGQTVHVTAEVDASAAEQVLDSLEALGVPAGEMGLARRDWIQPAGARMTAASVLMWADVLSTARIQSRVVGRHLGLMAVAGVIAGYGVVIDNPILIVGAMAVSPDLVPLIAASIGIVSGRWGLVRRGAATLVIGLGLASVAAFSVTTVLNALGLLPTVDVAQGFMASFTEVGVGTVGVALAAGVAGVLAFESRAGAAVGVAISVTTIPAAAMAGVTAGLGEWSLTLGALALLGVNLVCLIAAGVATLVIQRRVAHRRGRAP
jgi:uncharacterized hydrophobic protein (TIGR00271 family)